MSAPAPTPVAAEPTIRYATEEDIPTILALIHELALYEKSPSSVLATPTSLRQTLTFPSNPSHGYAKTLLIFPPAPAPAPAPTTPSSAPPPSSSTSTDPTPPPTQPPSISPSTPHCAGMALFFTNYSTWRGAPGIYLEDLFVRPEYRGRGYGQRLLRRLAQETEAIGGGRLEWMVLRWNEPSLRFYEGIGARRLEEWVGMRVEGRALGGLARGEVRGEGGEVRGGEGEG